jgi:hypothetical protein
MLSRFRWYCCDAISFLKCHACDESAQHGGRYLHLLNTWQHLAQHLVYGSDSGSVHLSEQVQVLAQALVVHLMAGCPQLTTEETKALLQ